MFFMTVLFRDKSRTLFLLENEHLHIFSGGFLIIVNKFFYYLLLQIYCCRIKQKSIQPCFLDTKTPKINTRVTKIWCVVGLSQPFDLVCLQYSSSARASSPTTRLCQFPQDMDCPSFFLPRCVRYYFCCCCITRIKLP